MRAEGLMMSKEFIRRGVRGTLALIVALSFGACDNLLRVENPSVIDERDVTDPKFIPALVNTAVNELHQEASCLDFAGASVTDEAVNGHNYTQWEEIDLRIIKDDNKQLPSIYQALQKARAVSDDMTDRLREVVSNPDRSVEVATTLAYAGYAYTRLGEYFCEAPVVDAGPFVSSDERSEEHTSELQSRGHLVCRLLLEKKKGKVEEMKEGGRIEPDGNCSRGRVRARGHGITGPAAEYSGGGRPMRWGAPGDAWGERRQG